MVFFYFKYLFKRGKTQKNWYLYEIKEIDEHYHLS